MLVRNLEKEDKRRENERGGREREKEKEKEREGERGKEEFYLISSVEFSPTR